MPADWPHINDKHNASVRMSIISQSLHGSRCLDGAKWIMASGR